MCDQRKMCIWMKLDDGLFEYKGLFKQGQVLFKPLCQQVDLNFLFAMIRWLQLVNCLG